jgi:uncharacterized membrane protein
MKSPRQRKSRTVFQTVRLRGRFEKPSYMNSEVQKAAGEVSPPSRSLTGPAKPRRSVCAPGAMASSFYRRPALERRMIMWFSSWLGKRQRSTPSGRSHKSPRKRSTCRPQLEALEDRTVPSGGYVFKTIDDPNAVNGTRLNGINSRGQVVGNYFDANFNGHSFLLSGGRYIGLNDPNGVNGTFAAGIDDSGEVVGLYVDANGLTHGFLLSHGHYTTLDVPNGNNTGAAGINDHGQIVGTYFDASEVLHSFLLSGGQYTTLDVPNGNNTQAYAINDSGKIVGYYFDSTGLSHGFLLSGGHYTTLDDPNAVSNMTAFGINSRGQVVGSYGDASGLHGFLLSGGQYTNVDDPNGVFSGRVFSEATGISDSGKIVGLYADASGSHGFLATKRHDDDGLGDDAPANPSRAAGRASGDSAHLLLPTASLTNATFTANQVITVAGGSGADRSDGSSDISTVPTWAAATLPSPLPGSGDSTGGRVRVVSAAGNDMSLTGNDVFARTDEVFRVDL